MAQRITVYIDDGLLEKFDQHIDLIKRSTAISELMEQELKEGRLK